MIRRLLLLAAATTALAVRPARTDEFHMPPSGADFSALSSCDDRLLFTAMDALLPVPDTLLVDPRTGDLGWAGGPVRGIASGARDTVLVAVRTGAAVFTKDGQIGFRPWSGVTGWVGDDWPSAAGPSTRPSVLAGPVQPFPERYLSLADGRVIFLQDADNPPPVRGRWHDLHIRQNETTEWLAARNLEVRSWVISPDSLSWAVIARVHVPDYGGSVRHLVIAGAEGSFDTFELGFVRSALWDGAGRLWLLEASGGMKRLDPGPRGWTVETVVPTHTAAPDCEPGERERLWVWAMPRGYTEYYAARQQSNREAVTVHGVARRGWVTRDDRGHYRACWGGALEREGLLDVFPETPVPGARAERLPVGNSSFLGPVARLRVDELDGEASLRRVLVGNMPACELWWRYDGPTRWIRLAGPWTP